MTWVFVLSFFLFIKKRHVTDPLSRTKERNFFCSRSTTFKSWEKEKSPTFKSCTAIPIENLFGLAFHPSSLLTWLANWIHQWSCTVNAADTVYNICLQIFPCVSLLYLHMQYDHTRNSMTHKLRIWSTSTTGLATP